MKMRRDTPPSSNHGDEFAEGEEEEMIYVGDADEVLDFLVEDGSANGDFDMDQYENEEPPPRDVAIRTFDLHAGSVFCCDFYPGGKFAVTGGEDDKAYVWNVETGVTINECVGHEDSVVIAVFSPDGAYLATADMSGSIFVWNCNLEENQICPWNCAFQYQCDDISWGRWHPQSRILICGTIDGDIYFWEISSGDTKILPSHGSKTECGLVLPGGTSLASGYEDGSTKIWDMNNSTVLHHIIPDPNYASSIITMDVNLEGTLLVTGCYKGRALLINIATGKKIGILDNGPELEHISFCKEPQMPYLATGTLDGDIKIWDVSKQMIRHTCSQKGDDDASGVTRLLWIKNIIVAGCLDGALRIYEGRSGELLETLTGHRSEILELAYSPADKILLTVSDDNTAKIFKSNTLSNFVDT